ncbi:hypothetical protein CSUB01_08164 [Colletotrichum sublineola]|uniref:Uncharacterized protein n=1 Tax=Colletotrichum sublineola TaxID=1173701 RepID=A0A066XPX8_COLSU|nr:hypothetical protein CSUB01_08164 [Colletotrichum sublineola]
MQADAEPVRSHILSPSFTYTAPFEQGGVASDDDAAFHFYRKVRTERQLQHPNRLRGSYQRMRYRKASR